MYNIIVINEKPKYEIYKYKCNNVKQILNKYLFVSPDWVE